jgi:ATP phosphoribosyltransferase
MTLRIAIQKAGRLHEDSVKLLRECGIEINNGVNQLRTEAANFPLEVFFLRDDDIPQYVEDGVADAGMVGENVVMERQKQIRIMGKLGFGRCRLSMAVNRSFKYETLSDLSGLRIATSYPVVLRKFLQENNLQADIHEISGSVEIAPGIGLADAICDLVSSGSTLFMNGLKEIQTVLVSETVMIASNVLNPEKDAILQKLMFRINSVRKARNNKYILLNAPNEKLAEIVSLLPGMKSPTVLPLAQQGWSSVHSVVNEDDFWDIIENLKACGAQGILVVPIEKMIQ